MAMESIQGYTPTNTIQRSVTPQIDRTATDPQNQQTSVSDVDNNENSGQTGQLTFQVDITQQARDRLAAASDNTQDNDGQKAVLPDVMPPGQPGPGAGQIINIVA